MTFSIVVPDHDSFSGEIRSTASGVSLLTMVDAVRAMLGRIEVSQQEGDVDYSGLIARLTELQTEQPADAAPPAPAPPLPTRMSSSSKKPRASSAVM